MKKLFKWILILAAVAAVLLLAAFFTLKMLFPTEKLKSFVENYAQNTLHREVTFSDISFNLIGVTLNDVRISESTTFEQGMFIQADHAILKIALKPLFKKQIKISTIGLKGLKVNLLKNEEGKLNFDDLMAPSSSETTEQNTDAPTKESTAFPFDVSAEDFYAKNCSIFYKDLQGKQEINLTKLNLDVDDFDLANPFQASLQFILHYADENTTMDLPVNSRFTIQLANLDLGNAYVTLQELTATYQSIKATLKGNVKNFEQPSINLQANISGISNQSLAPLVADLPEFALPVIEFTTDIQTDLAASTANIKQAKLTLAKAVLTATGNAGWGGEKPTYQIQSDLHVDLNQLSNMIAALNGYALAGTISGKFTATDKKDGQDIQGTLDLDQINFQYTPVTLSEVKGLIKLASLQDISSNKITGKLNGESFTTSFTYKDLGSILDIGWQLNLSKLLLDSFSTDSTQTPSEESAPSAPSATAPTQETLFNLKATVNIGEIAVPYIVSQGATLNVDLQKASASLKQANGKVSFVLREGSITDIMKTIKSYKLVKIILLPLSLVNKVSHKLGISLFTKNNEDADQIKFQSGSGSYVFTNGIMNIEETHFNSAISDITAAGNINFQSEAIDMQVKASVLTSQTPIVMKIGGTVSEPSGKLDITKTAVSLVGGILNYKTPGKVASSTAKTAANTTKNVVNTGSHAVTNTVNTAANAVKSIGGLFKKEDPKEKTNQ